MIALKNTKIFLSFFMSFLLLFFSKALFGREARWTHYGLRPLGMGNAFVSVADDFNAIFYNPAGLAYLKKNHGELFNPGFEVASATVSFLGELKTFAQGQSKDVTDSLQLLNPQMGRIHHGGVYWTPHLVFQNFGFGLGLYNMVNLTPHSQIDIELEAGSELIMPFCGAASFLDGRLGLGLSAKLVGEAKIDDHFNLGNLSTLNQSSQGGGVQDLMKKGYGVGFDFGLLMMLAEQMQPTFGLSAMDIGGTSYKAFPQADGLKPAARHPSLNMGLSFKPVNKNRTYFLVAIEVHRINQPVHYSHKYVLGFEWAVGDLLKIQAGLKEGGFTAGFQMDAGLINLRIVTYPVDHAPIAGLHAAMIERRYAFQMKMLI